MLLSIKDLVDLIRQQVNIQNSKKGVVDSSFLDMQDEDILLYIKLAATRIYPGIQDLEEIEDDKSFSALMLLVQSELYKALAVLNSPDVDMGADNNNYLKNSQRFTHYMELASQAEQQYDKWLENESSTGTVNTYEVLNTKYAHTKRNYELQQKPVVTFASQDVTSDSVDLSWDTGYMPHFGMYILLFNSARPCLDMFADGSSYKDKMTEGTIILRRTLDYRNNAKTVTGLEPSTVYFFAVVALCRNGVWGYKELNVTTLESIEEDEGETDIQPGEEENPPETEPDGGEGLPEDKPPVTDNAEGEVEL